MSVNENTGPKVSPARPILWALVAIVALCGFGWSLHELGSGFEARFDSILQGTDQEAVRRLLGEPNRVLEPFEVASATERKLHEKFGIGYEWWIYDRQGDSIGSKTRFVVLFDKDKVARTEKRFDSRE